MGGEEGEGEEGVDGVIDAPVVWTDGCLVQDQVSGASSSGSGFYAHLPGMHWDRRKVRTIWMVFGPMIGWFSPAGGSALFRDPCILFKGLSAGGLFLLCRHLCPFILGWITLALSDTLADCWMGFGIPVLLSC